MTCRFMSDYKPPRASSAAIDAFVAAYNEKAEPFVWTKKKIRQRRFKNPPSDAETFRSDAAGPGQRRRRRGIARMLLCSFR